MKNQEDLYWFHAMLDIFERTVWENDLRGQFLKTTNDRIDYYQYGDYFFAVGRRHDRIGIVVKKGDRELYISLIFLTDTVGLPKRKEIDLTVINDSGSMPITLRYRTNHPEKPYTHSVEYLVFATEILEDVVDFWNQGLFFRVDPANLDHGKNYD